MTAHDPNFPHDEVSGEPPQPEPLSIDIRKLIAVTLGLVGLVVGTMAGIAVKWSSLPPDAGTARRDAGNEPRKLVAGAPGQPPADPDQARRRAAYEASQRELLKSYGWVDRDRKIARIPIQRAIDILVHRRKEN